MGDLWKKQREILGLKNTRQSETLSSIREGTEGPSGSIVPRSSVQRESKTVQSSTVNDREKRDRSLAPRGSGQ